MRVILKQMVGMMIGKGESGCVRPDGETGESEVRRDKETGGEEIYYARETVGNIGGQNE